MNWKTVVLLALAMGATSSAHAQAIYKTIGPDGRVIYSDKPPVGAAKPAVPASPSPAADARASNKPPVGASTRPSTVATPPAQSSPSLGQADASAPDQGRIDPVLERALIRVMGNEDLLSRTEEVCLQTLPTSFKKYNAAAASWKQRNAAVLAQYRRVMSEGVTESQRQLLEARVKSINDPNMAIVANAPVASRISWCDKSFQEIGSGKIDLHDAPDVSGPLMDYRPKAG
jgi:hypothetical protein